MLIYSDDKQLYESGALLTERLWNNKAASHSCKKNSGCWVTFSRFLHPVVFVWLTSCVIKCCTCNPVLLNVCVCVCLCVCVNLPVEGTLAWNAPGFLWEWPTFQFWWIRNLLTLRLPFRKGGFREAKQKPEVLRGTDVEEEEEGGKDEGRINRLVFVGRLYIMHKWTISPAESSTHPAGHQRRHCHHDPHLCLSLSHSEISSQRQHCVTMAKPNNWQFVNRAMCVCFRLTTAFPPSLSPSPYPTQDREIACNWLWMDCGWQEGRAVCLL